MIPPQLISDIEVLIRRSHKQWMEAVCATLNNAADSLNASALIEAMPNTNNNDAAHCLANVLWQAEGLLPWKALGASLDLCSTMYSRYQEKQTIELLWSGPSPGSQIPARRIDQMFYDLIASSTRDILLVTFAAHKIPKLTEGLLRALNRGVHVRLILEFEEASLGQLSIDAMNAFPETVRQRSEIYYWPLNKREKNSSGRPGKLHAKVAVIDDKAVLSSANLTDDAFSRNCELGILFSDSQVLDRIRHHFEGLCADGTFKRWECSTGTGANEVRK
jgi:phosphatidylserine/phosphatidylglycerophosphate/cardiolipin synthase-like enzyme